MASEAVGWWVGVATWLPGTPSPPLPCPLPWFAFLSVLAEGRQSWGAIRLQAGCTPPSTKHVPSILFLKSPQPLHLHTASCVHTHTHTHTHTHPEISNATSLVPLNPLLPHPQSSWCGGQPGAVGQPPPTSGPTGASWTVGCWPTTPLWTP